MRPVTFLHIAILTNLFVLIFACAGPPAQAVSSETTDPDLGIVTKISISRGQFKISEDIMIRVVITNTSDQPLKILVWLTPFDGIDRSLFHVDRDGEPVVYTGKLIKRPAPTESDYLTLNAGESLFSDLDLKKYYNIADPGGYKIRYDVCSFDLYGITGGVNQNDANIHCLTTGDLEFVIER